MRLFTSLAPGYPRLLLLVGLIGMLLGATALAPAKGEQPNRASITSAVDTAPLCRFGVNHTGTRNTILSYDITALRSGWYLDYFAFPDAPTPNDSEYALIVSLTQVGANGYTYTPEKAELEVIVPQRPGAVWFIGNEPDRRAVQNDIEPHVYAAAYHELYYLIKSIDPTARIFAGTIVQPTPIRLLYLDMVLDAYYAAHGAYMPVDGWSIHNFILNEVSCDYDPANCWGAGIPPGIDLPFGEVIPFDQIDAYHDNVEVFAERIQRFRQWMYDRGYRDKPLLVSEYGILMPDFYGFDAARVNRFMTATFDYMLTATSPRLGNPHDDRRLVQGWSWYSTIDTEFNGRLFDKETFAMTAMGSNYASYTAPIEPQTDLYPARIFTDPPFLYSPDGAAVDLVLQATIANSGNQGLATAPVTVRFYHKDPLQGDVQIGASQSVALPGCGRTATVAVPWTDVPPGAHEVTVIVDQADAVAEENEQNNVLEYVVVVATHLARSPVITR